MAHQEPRNLSERYLDNLETILDDVAQQVRGDGIQNFLCWYRDASLDCGLDLALHGKIQFAETLHEIGKYVYAREIYAEIRDTIIDDEESLDDPKISSYKRSDFSHAVQRGFDLLNESSTSLASSICSQQEIDSLSREAHSSIFARDHDLPHVTAPRGIPDPALVPATLAHSQNLDMVPLKIKRYKSFSAYQQINADTKRHDFEDHGNGMQPLEHQVKDDTSRATPLCRNEVLSYGSKTRTKTDTWFQLLEANTHALVYGEKMVYKGLLPNRSAYPRVRIAVLDSGIAYTRKEDRRKLAHAGMATRIVKWENFIPGETTQQALNDDAGHGTIVAYQICKTSATAELYVARVVHKEGDDWVPLEGAVTKAIRYAVDEWKVDIINMSFGIDKLDDDLESAILHARNKDVLMFAATTNYGLTNLVDIMVPASEDGVFAVEAADGLGHIAGYHAAVEAQVDKPRLTAPGLEIASPLSDELEEGSSFAVPIAAGAAALVLEFASQHPLNKSPEVRAKLKKHKTMMHVLRHMVKKQTSEKFLFVRPWDLLMDKTDGRFGGDGSIGTQRWIVAYKIVEMLRAIYKGSIGEAAVSIASRDRMGAASTVAQDA